MPERAVAFAIAILIATTFCVIELRSRLRSRMTFARWCWAWWVGRLALEGMVAAGAVLLVEAGVITAGAQMPGLPQWLLLGIAGGMAGPAVLRQRFVTLGQGEHEQPIGVATFFEPVRDFVEDAIDEIGSSEQVKWQEDLVLPRIQSKGITSEQFGNRLGQYINSRSRLEGRDRHLAFITATLPGDKVSDDVTKMRALLQLAINIKAFRVVDDLIR